MAIIFVNQLCWWTHQICMSLRYCECCRSANLSVLRAARQTVTLRDPQGWNQWTLIASVVTHGRVEATLLFSHACARENSAELTRLALFSRCLIGFYLNIVFGHRNALFRCS